MTLTVKGLIKELKKYPMDSPVGFYSWNRAYRPDAGVANRVQSVELCNDGKTVALVGGFE